MWHELMTFLFRHPSHPKPPERSEKEYKEDLSEIAEATNEQHRLEKRVEQLQQRARFVARKYDQPQR